jgi:hypothetical protein
MKLEQFKPLFQILQNRHHSELSKFENLKSWPENVQNSLKLPKHIIKYLNLCIGGVLSFEFEMVFN